MEGRCWEGRGRSWTSAAAADHQFFQEEQRKKNSLNIEIPRTQITSKANWKKHFLSNYMKMVVASLALPNTCVQNVRSVFSQFLIWLTIKKQ